MQDFISNQYWRGSSSKLGGIYPYYNDEKNDLFTLDFSKVITERRRNNLPVKLDSSALVIKFCLPYLLGSRTLIKNISKTPWMAEHIGEGQWQPHSLPEHGHSLPDEKVFTLMLKEALIDEAIEYIAEYQSIGILLSGGMDSRVLAGILRELEIRKDSNFKIIALTWGAKESRDVIYAHRIAEQFDWDIVHYPLTAETLSRNIKYAGQQGAEFSAFHLHAMEEVSNTAGIDIIIAGSYGDSVGRAEFSGTHLTHLKSIIPTVLDPYGFIKSNALNKAKNDLNTDLADTKHLTDNTPTIRKKEIEQEMHYMRRMLQACMQTISLKIPLYQLFTNPNVFGLMWSLDPKVRNNDWYFYLLKELPGNLLEIPWARNGKLYNKPNSAVLDDYSKSYHQYGTWFRNDLREEVLMRINSNYIQDLDIFNEKSLDRLIKNWSKAKTKDISRFDESIAWLCSLHDMIKIYELPELSAEFNQTHLDSIRGNIGSVNAHAFISIRNKLRE